MYKLYLQRIARSKFLLYNVIFTFATRVIGVTAQYAVTLTVNLLQYLNENQFVYRNIDILKGPDP